MEFAKRAKNELFSSTKQDLESEKFLASSQKQDKMMIMNSQNRNLQLTSSHSRIEDTRFINSDKPNKTPEEHSITSTFDLENYR